MSRRPSRRGRGATRRAGVVAPLTTSIRALILERQRERADVHSFCEDLVNLCLWRNGRDERGSMSLVRKNTHSLARVIRSAAVLSALAVLTSGCALLEGPTPETPPRETVAPPAEPPQFYPEGTADDNLPYFAEVLRAFGEEAEPVAGVPIVDAVSAAGFDRQAMQVSFDKSQTNLDADSIYVSVRWGTECLIGQVVAGDRSTYAVVEPAVGPNQDICLIGNTRAIDW